MNCKSKTVGGTKVVALVASVCALALAGCASTKEGIKPVNDISVPEDTIDWKGHDVGKQFPAWLDPFVDSDKAALKKVFGIDKDAVVFLVEEIGDNLDYLKERGDLFGASVQVARALETTVATVAKGDRSGEGASAGIGVTGSMEEQLDRIAREASNITLNGFRKEADFWTRTRRLKTESGVRKATSEDDWEYKITYRAVFWMEGDIFKKQLNAAMDDILDNDDQTAALRELLTQQCYEFLGGGEGE